MKEKRGTGVKAKVELDQEKKVKDRRIGGRYTWKVPD